MKILKTSFKLNFFSSYLAVGIAIAAAPALAMDPDGNVSGNASAATWRMPEIPQLSQEQHAHVEARLQAAPIQDKNALFEFVQHNLLSEYPDRDYAKYIIQDVDALTTDIFAGKSETTYRLFFHCVGLANQRLQLHNETAAFKDRPMGIAGLRQLMNAITLFPEEEQTVAVEMAESLFSTTGNAYSMGCITNILYPLSRIPLEKRESLVAAALKLGFLQSPGKILAELGDAPEGEVHSITSFIVRLAREYEGCIQIRNHHDYKFLKTIVNLSSARRERFLEDVRPFMTFPDMNQESEKDVFAERKGIVGAIASLPEEGLEGLFDHVTALRRRVQEVAPSERATKVSYYGALIESLGRVPGAERPAIMDELLGIVQGTTWGEPEERRCPFNREIGSLLKRIRTCKQHNPHYLEYLEEMLSMTNNRVLEAREPLLWHLGDFLEYNEDVAMGPMIRRISRLLPYLLPDDGSQPESFTAIRMANEIHSGLADFDQIIPFLELPISQEQRIKIIETLVEMTMPQHRLEGYFVYVNPHDRDDFLTEALRLCRLPIESPDYRRILIRLAAAAQQGRDGLVEGLVNLDRPSYTQEEVEQALGEFIRGLDRIWLDQEGQVVPGLDVHHGDRDQRVTEALGNLVATQGHMSTETLMTAVTACKAYIATGGFTDPQQQRALIALEGERTREGWGPLLCQEASPAFAGLDGVGLVGRLWRFADSYVDPSVPNDAENARRAFVTALVDSANTDGWMVCNLGKIQRIVVGVLQGRLAEAVVDREARADVVAQSAAPASEQAPAPAVGGAAAAAAAQPLEAEQAPVLTGQRLAALYLQTLQDVAPPETEATMCAAAAAWLRAQPIEVDEERQRAFFEDITTFFRMR